MVNIICSLLIYCQVSSARIGISDLLRLHDLFHLHLDYPASEPLQRASGSSSLLNFWSNFGVWSVSWSSMGVCMSLHPKKGVT